MNVIQNLFITNNKIQEILKQHASTILEGDVTTLAKLVRERSPLAHDASVRQFLEEACVLVYLPLDILALHFKAVYPTSLTAYTLAYVICQVASNATGSMSNSIRLVACLCVWLVSKHVTHV